MKRYIYSCWGTFYSRSYVKIDLFSSDGGNYSIILMEFDSGNRIMTYCYWEVQKDGK